MSSPTTSSAAAVSSRLDRGAIAVITGGGSGFGLETARRCSAAGMKVAICDFMEASLKAAVAELRANGNNDVFGVNCDVSDPEQCEAFAQAVEDRFPGSHLSFLFNNAGVGVQAQVLKATQRDWQNVFGVNVFGAGYIAKAFINRAIKKGPNPSGSRCQVVTTASIVGVLPFASGLYSMSKYATLHLSETLNDEIRALGPRAQHISIHSLQPSMAGTNFFSTPKKLGMVDGSSGSRGLDVDVATGLAKQMAKRFGAKEVVDGMMAGLEKDLFYIHVQADGDTPFHELRLRYFNAVVSGNRPHQPFSDFANMEVLMAPPPSKL